MLAAMERGTATDRDFFDGRLTLVLSLIPPITSSSSPLSPVEESPESLSVESLPSVPEVDSEEEVPEVD